MLIDTHCHLDDDRLFENAEDIVGKFEQYGIEAVINAGSDYCSSKRSVELAEKYEKVYATVGIHPEEANADTNAAYEYFVSVGSNPKLAAIGEAGLDYYHENASRETQKKVLTEQIELAHYLRLPIVLHLRDAFADMYEILKENQGKLVYGGILHCYSGSKEMLEQFNKFDLFYSVGGAVTFKNYAKFEMLQSIPYDRLMLETDSPYMTPVPFRGRINTPLNVGLVAEKLAEILNKDKEEIVLRTSLNAKTIYGRLK